MIGNKDFLGQLVSMIDSRTLGTGDAVPDGGGDQPLQDGVMRKWRRQGFLDQN